MALKEYKWRGGIWQIADEDLHLYPGAEPAEAKPKAKEKKTPANKSRRSSKNK